MRSLDHLNPEQLSAVEYSDGHLLVVAGAGSGKTRVLTHKIVYLVESCNVFPGSIVAMTFSNKAAQEMKERIAHLLPRYEQPHWIGTFHSICLRILKEFHEEVGLRENFSIYDEQDQLSLLKRILKAQNLDPKEYPPKVIRYHIDRAKNETPHVLDLLKKEEILGEKALEIAALYQKGLQQNSAVDFGDLLGKTLLLLQRNEEVRESLQKRWNRFLIDEYQDTNRIQKELILQLVGPSGIVCAVGDEDQSIYGWRGACVENILEFQDDFPGAQVLKLERNYRSTKKILSVANSVICHNIGRRAKELWTENQDGEMVSFYQAENDYAEAEYVFDQALAQINRGEVQPGEVSVFYRTHVQSRVLEEDLRRRNVPYRIFGGIRFYDRAEVKDLLAFLRLAVNPSDNISLVRIINTPSRGVGAKTISNLAQRSADLNCSMFEAIPFHPGKTKGDRALHDFHAWFSVLASDAAQKPAVEVAESIMEESGYIKALEKEGTVEAESRVEHIQEVMRSMEEFEEQGVHTLPEYLDRISLVADTDSYDSAEQAITLMTIHNAKGLEFDSVFVVGLEEGIFPHQRSIDEGTTEEIEEERRLCYVAMTRARKRLTLTAAQRRRLYQSIQYNPISRFIDEIPSRNLLNLTPQDDSWEAPRKTFKKRQEYDEFAQDVYDDDESLYAPGTRVIHPSLGMGTVRKCEGDSDNLKVTIQFKQGGTKKILLNYCDLERVDG